MKNGNLLKHKVIWFFSLFYINNKWKKEPPRTGFMEGSCSFFFVFHWLQWLLRLHHGKGRAAFRILWKHFQSHSLGMKVQVQLSIENGTRSNMLQIPSDISSRSTQRPSEERLHRTLPEELRSIRHLPTHPSFLLGGGGGTQAKLQTVKATKEVLKGAHTGC